MAETVGSDLKWGVRKRLEFIEFRLFWDGRLNRGDLAEVWLWADCHSDVAWPVRRGALQLLYREGLATPVRPRSLVREATELVAAQLARLRPA